MVNAVIQLVHRVYAVIKFYSIFVIIVVDCSVVLCWLRTGELTGVVPDTVRWFSRAVRELLV